MRANFLDDDNGFIKEREVTKLDNKAKLLVMLFGIFAIMALINMEDVSADLLRTGQGSQNYTIQNSTILNGNGTSAAVRLVIRCDHPVSCGDGNWSVYGVFYNTSLNTWSRLTLGGVSGNSSCSGRTCNHTLGA